MGSGSVERVPKGTPAALHAFQGNIPGEQNTPPDSVQEVGKGFVSAPWSLFLGQGDTDSPLSCVLGPQTPGSGGAFSWICRYFSAQRTSAKGFSAQDESSSAAATYSRPCSVTALGGTAGDPDRYGNETPPPCRKLRGGTVTMNCMVQGQGLDHSA
ncbi:hypothetical protein MJT46_010350 [Ovis ammon polii x Ovis aries]|nr:hypothetical protein MJT46_010350 [Ovis ammon polii x Ovis aries]